MTVFEKTINQSLREIKLPLIGTYITRVLGDRRVHATTKAVPDKDTSMSDNFVDRMMATKLATEVSRATGKYVDPLPLETVMALKRTANTSPPKK